LRQWLGAWAAYLKAGDLLVLALALVACGLSALTLWQGRPDKAVIKSGGRVFAEVDLTVPRILEVPGRLVLPASRSSPAAPGLPPTPAAPVLRAPRVVESCRCSGDLCAQPGQSGPVRP
jgi:hypothetical protein